MRGVYAKTESRHGNRAQGNRASGVEVELGWSEGGRTKAMKKSQATFELADAKRRYANARRRARFWSGNPSLSNFGPTGRNLTTGRMDEKYELAMCDCDSWEQTIGRLTGKEVSHYDPKQAFRRRFAALMSTRRISQ